MFNPFDFEKDDAKFVAATKDAHERDMKIARLAVARSWMLVGLVTQSFLLLGALLLSSRFSLSQLPLQMAMFVMFGATFSNIDLQIKVLKASRTV